MKPFLYLDCWHERQAPTAFDKALAATGLPIETYCTNDGAFPDHMDFSGAYVSPSFNGAYDNLPWVNRLHDVLREFGTAGVPMLGVCFGSQILASSLVGRDQVFIRSERERGPGHIRLTAAGREDLLSRNVPEKVASFHWHGDEVRADHPDIVILADSSDCGNQIWRWAGHPVWGVQAHIELGGDGLKGWLAGNPETFLKGGLDPAAVDVETVFDERSFGFLQNFLDFVLERERDKRS